MVAYSFQRMFVDPIRVGLGHKLDGVFPKRQTIRAHGKRRHAHAGEELQLYCAMRQPSCFLIGVALCERVRPVRIAFGDSPAVIIDGEAISSSALDLFATTDGFDSWGGLCRFWDMHHPGVREFSGRIIEWRSP